MSTTFGYSDSSPADPRNLPFRGLLAFGVAWVLAFLVLSTIHARHLDWNASRLAPAFALARGLTIYPPPDSGVLTGQIYPPLGAFAYLPVTWISDVSSMMSAGSMLAISYFTLPFVLLIRFAINRTEADRQMGIAALICGLLVVGLDPSLRYAATMVHAESPAAGLGCLAIVLAAAAYLRPSLFVWSGAAAAAACMAKQTWILAPPLLLVLVAWRNGRTSALRFLAGGAAVAFLSALAIACCGNWRNLFFNLVTVPVAHAWETQSWRFDFHSPHEYQTPAERLRVLVDVFTQLTLRWWPGFIAASWALLRWWPRPFTTGVLERAAFFAACLACAQFPLALAGAAKVGGGVNTLAPLLAPLLLCLVALAVRLSGRGSSVPKTSWTAGILILIACTFPRLVFLAKVARQPDLHRPMASFVQSNPGQVYLPWNPLITLLAEGRRDHFESGIFERVLAGHPPSDRHIRSGLPPQLRYVAVRRNQPPSCREMHLHYLPEARLHPSPAGLEDWIFYTTDPAAVSLHQ